MRGKVTSHHWPRKEAIDPKGAVSLVLGTVGGWLGAGIFLEKVAAAKGVGEHAATQTAKAAVEAATQADKLGFIIADGTAAAAIGTALGAIAAVLGGLAGAELIRRLYDTTKAWALGILSIAVGAAVGAVVGLVLGFLFPNLTQVVHWNQWLELRLPALYVGAVVGGIAGFMDSFVY